MPRAAMAELGREKTAIIGCSDGARGFEELPRRWVVERTFARLSIAHIRLLTRRPLPPHRACPSHAPPEVALGAPAYRPCQRASRLAMKAAMPSALSCVPARIWNRRRSWARPCSSVVS